MQHYLWENHPSIKILTELTESVFEKDHLPCVFIDKDEGLIGPTFIFHGSIANKFGQPIRVKLCLQQKTIQNLLFNPQWTYLKKSDLDIIDVMVLIKKKQIRKLNLMKKTSKSY